MKITKFSHEFTYQNMRESLFNNSKFDMKKIVGGDSTQISMHINSFDYDIQTEAKYCN